jgi:protoporphyrinogen IX oxidase
VSKSLILAIVVGVLMVALLALWRPSQLYLIVKALHVISIVAWMAGLLYLPRLFVYHCKAEPASIASETFKVMERRLLRVIMNPAMITAWILGLWLAWDGGSYAAGWLQTKFALVLALSGVHVFFAYCVRDFASDQNRYSAGFYRFINELPTVLMIGIVLLAVVKPF